MENVKKKYGFTATRKEQYEKCDADYCEALHNLLKFVSTEDKSEAIDLIVDLRMASNDMGWLKGMQQVEDKYQ